MFNHISVPGQAWSNISDFVSVMMKTNGFDDIIVVIDRLTKMAVFVATSTTAKASKCVELLLNEVSCKIASLMKLLPIKILSLLTICGQDSNRD